jgi:Ferritin-like domain
VLNKDEYDLTKQDAKVPVMTRRRFLTHSVAVFGGGALEFAFSGAPASVQTALASGPSDIDILNYALTLERLEKAFYMQGLQTFTATDSPTDSLFVGSAGG